MAPRLSSFYISKGKELNNPLDPKSGETGNLIYNMSETYASAAGVAKHMELAAPWPGMATLVGYAEKYGIYMCVGATVFTNLVD